jgi:hypothetical protein
LREEREGGENEREKKISRSCGQRFHGTIAEN